MSEQTLLYGIGAAKAGTSWLHRYLSGHPECHFRSLKELHYFNTTSAHPGDEGGNWPRQYRDRRLATITQRLASKGDFAERGRVTSLKSDIEEWHGILDQHGLDAPGAHDAAYLDFLRSGAGDARIVGEITPAYATLDARDFERMAAIAPDTKFIFILRDPLARLWSNIRMTAKRAARNGADAKDVAAEQVAKYLRGENASLVRRSDYRGTIERLLSAVPQADVLFEFFENLFSQAALHRITDFLGISAHVANLDQPVHKGQSLQLASQQKTDIRAALAPQYDFINSMFGANVPENWHHTDRHSEIAG